ncbi:MAG: outer membrane protein transport protein [Deltaproteobacteria bacterium]|nr:outer membrane protein transport protein [Deltaproteobacteria bacterium]
MQPTMSFPAALLLTLALAAGSCPRPAAASMLQVPHIGGRDGGLSGNVVASPADGASILLFNAAGIVGRSGTEISSSFATATVSGRYTSPQAGYDEKSSESPFGPLLWVGSDGLAPWYVGGGLYGTVGASFNFAADPAAGVPEQLLAESGLVQLGLVVGRELAPGLRFGVQAGPTWGRIRTRAPSPLGAVHFDIDGFGVTGAAGLLYDLNRATTLGLSYRGPGIVFMGGGGQVGGQSERVTIDFHTPQSVVLGIAHRVTPQLLVTAQATWTDYPNFENGEFEFERNPQLNQRFISAARSTVRYGMGLEYAAADWLWLRSGFSREEWMMEASALSPLLYDTTDSMAMLGIGVAHGRWTIDANVGLGIMEDRVVTTADQPLFPGRYQLESSPGFTVGVTYRVRP